MPTKSHKQRLREVVSPRARALAYANQISDDEDARLKAAALSDPDNPPLSEAEFARARRGRGRPKAAVTKQSCTVRLDRDVVERLKRDGDGWQTRMNRILRQHLKLGAPTKQGSAQRRG